MAITHFRIPEIPTRVNLAVDAVLIVLNQAYPLADQNLFSITNLSGFKSEKLDSIKYQLSIDNGTTWSNVATINVNDFAELNTPESANESITVSDQEQSSVPTLPINASTDRIFIIGSRYGNAKIKLSGNLLGPNQVVFIYDFANLAIENSLGGGEPYDEIDYQCGNHLGINSAITYKITLNVTSLAELAFVQRNVVYNTVTIDNQQYYQMQVTDIVQVNKAYVLKALEHTFNINSPMLTENIYSSVLIDAEEHTANETFLFYKNADIFGKATMEIRHNYIDFTGMDTLSQATLTLDEVDSDPLKVSVTNEYISNLAITGLAEGAAGAVTLYRSTYANGYIYAGYLDGATAIIKRSLNGTITQATGVTNLTTDWTNRFNLTYS